MSGRDITADGPATVSPMPRLGGEFPGAGRFAHVAVLYQGSGNRGAAGAGKGGQTAGERGRGEPLADPDLDWAGSMLRLAEVSNCPLQVAVTGGTLQALHAQFGPLTGARFDDMAEIGRNPARIIPIGRSFLDEHHAQHVYFLWEPAWPSRSSAELQEVARHDALVNLAFRRLPMTVACLYDMSRLPACVIRDARRTHPFVVSGGRQQASGSYLGGEFPPGCDDPLPPAARDAASVSFDRQLRSVREFSASQALAAGLEPARAGDLVLAVSEIAANSLGHADGRGVVRAWCVDDELVCQIEDRGHITDPLAGRRRLPADSMGGHGLWLVNRVCDLVERRTGEAGTITRLHMRRKAG